jgi:hypothetical protein
LAAPCRLLPAALTAVNADGEIWILDSANYNTGPVAINKGVTILAGPGVVGSVVASGGDALTISGAGFRVILKNLVFVNLGGGTNGVNFTAGSSSLTVQDSSFSGLSVGVNFNGSSSRGQVYNSTFNRNTTGVQVTGIFNIQDSQFANNTVAIAASGNGGAQNFPPNGSTRVRVQGGSIFDNAIAYSMTDPGLHNSIIGNCNGVNIFLRDTQVPNAIGNTNYVTLSGSADAQSNCPAQVMTYSVSATSTFP